MIFKKGTKIFELNTFKLKGKGGRVFLVRNPSSDPIYVTLRVNSKKYLNLNMYRSKNKTKSDLRSSNYEDLSELEFSFKREKFKMKVMLKPQYSYKFVLGGEYPYKLTLDKNKNDEIDLFGLNLGWESV